MTPARLAELRRRIAATRTGAPDGGVEPDLALALLDALEDCRRTERALRDERDRAEQRAEQAESAMAVLREELEEVTDGWFDDVRNVARGPGYGRPLLRAIDGGCGT